MSLLRLLKTTLFTLVVFTGLTLNVFAVNTVTTSTQSCVTQGGISREFVRTPNGTYFIFYYNGGIKFRTSTNSGSSWSVESSISGDAYGSPMAIEAISDASNNVYVAFTEGGYGSRQCETIKFSWNGSIYTQEAPYFFVSEWTVGYPEFFPKSLVLDKDGRIWLAIRYYNNGGKAIEVRTTTDGNTWDYRRPAAASSTLNGGIDTVATSITLTDATNFQGSGAVVIGSEWIEYSGKTGNVLTGCGRGAYSVVAKLNSDISAGTTSITGNLDLNGSVLSLARTDFPSGGGVLRIDTEFITYTGISAGAFTGCTVASSHSAGAGIVLAPVAHSTGAAVIQPPSGSTYCAIDMVKWNDYPSLFYNDGGTHHWLYYDGANWQTPTGTNWWTANTGFGYGVGGAWNFSVAVTEDNYIHAATWQPNTGIMVTSHDSAAGSSWTSWVTLQPKDNLDNGISVSMTTNGQDVWCFWRKYIAANSYDIVYKKGIRNGNSWTWDATETNITNDGISQGGVDSLGNNNKIGTIPVIWSTEPSSPFFLKIAQVAVPLYVKTAVPATISNLAVSTVTINGMGFFGANTSASVATISLSNGTKFTSYSVVDDILIQSAEIPSQIPAGTYNVIVKNTSGVSTFARNPWALARG